MHLTTFVTQPCSRSANTEHLFNIIVQKAPTVSAGNLVAALSSTWSRVSPVLGTVSRFLQQAAVPAPASQFDSIKPLQRDSGLPLGFAGTSNSFSKELQSGSLMWMLWLRGDSCANPNQTQLSSPPRGAAPIAFYQAEPAPPPAGAVRRC